MDKINKIILIAVLSSFCCTVFATLQGLNCKTRQIRQSAGNYYLNMHPTNHSQLYLIQNQGTKAVFLNHYKKIAGAGAGWASHLDAGLWSALVVSQDRFKLDCKTQTGRLQKDHCQLKVCLYPQNFPLKSGDYWLSENKTEREIAEALK